LRLLLFLALLFTIYYILRRFSNFIGLGPKRTTTQGGTTYRAPGEGNRGTGHGAVDELVKDPVCGVYVAKQQAILRGTTYRSPAGNKIICFCSNTCKSKYIDKIK